MRKFLFSGQEINKRGDIVSRQVVPLFTNLYNNTRISSHACDYLKISLLQYESARSSSPLTP